MQVKTRLKNNPTQTTNNSHNNKNKPLKLKIPFFPNFNQK